MNKSILTVTLLLTAFSVLAQEPCILFIGNSYTEVNNLPQMIYNVAQSTGESLTYASNTPGGCTFMQHCTNRSMEMICQGTWDIVVLQEQSQYPSFPQSQVENEVFPYAERLIDSIYAHNPCARPVFYMTWGRKNGDPGNASVFPVLGTYEGMDSMLYERYTYMAHTYDADLCPVGRVWRYLRENHRDIELYQGDGSHPSTAGSYAAACAFYTLIFHRDPDSITYTAGLEEPTAETIRSAAHTIVFEHLSDWLRPIPVAEAVAVHMHDDNTLWFSSNSTHADSLTWHFGDDNDTTIAAGNNLMISHTYADSGDYTVTLVASRHCMSDTSTLHVHVNGDTSSVAIIVPTYDNGEVKLFPNPTYGETNLTLPSPAIVTLTCIDGRTLWHKRFESGSNPICIRQLPNGTYILNVATANSNTTHKLIKR